MKGDVPEEIVNAMHATMAQCTIAAQIARQNYEHWHNRAARVSRVIMPPTGALTMTGAGVEVRNTSDLVIRDGDAITVVD
jgi:hypothetical protein